MHNLLQILKQINGTGYKGYKRIQGRYQADNYDLAIDYVQGDPFASPSKIRVIIPVNKRAIQPAWLETYSRKIATEDAFARVIGKEVATQPTFIKGSGKSGLILFDRPGQEKLERTAVQISSTSITVCLSIGLPANGRKINSKEAEKLFTQALPAIIDQSVFAITDETIEQAIKLADQQDAIRETMKQEGWVAFLANGSILPRESGISNRPLKQAVPFQSPAENEVAIDIPHAEEPIKGMAIKQGITLIVGGGYHGKSTLLQAVERGVYAHVHGDGREFVLTDPAAVKIRAEDGRKVTGVDISPFINNLPHGQDTTFFSTDNASGSTSQAANVIEALEAGASTLLMDEDTSATNFMIRDHRMQLLVHPDKEPITPFIDKIKQLRDELTVSTIIVMGGSGDYFAHADTVIRLENYLPDNATNEAKAIMKKYPLERKEKAEEPFHINDARYFQQQTLQTKKGNRSKVQAKGLSHIIMGNTDIDFSEVEQLVDPSQTRMIAEILQHLDYQNKMNQLALPKLLDKVEEQMNKRGLASFTAYPDQHPGDLARPRRFELAAVINRMRTTVVKRR
ncbi:ABC-ATPase domain-containing protein [Virgibacillus pantothenticus]|uniref:ABC-ATPase domain-containing protein n=1 Tax=Virgibacillus pantothenticus TaxID=1473 RepID=UPI001C218C1C|nr:ABC-ATPase domain-containing protein [Virgibacillus pantothenticus]MBU8566845.1 ABC-ATPase domain-containing protein [Virgibacillus pantothenticus]MBU8600462.1 ABC-ATPase domain-containing protein [Virgibacillus pantothenticus]MBU8635143.1 ABC-ATPase domain-containing protein [Virgibacillus pantothenticus]MBU8642564.1 ABC-ATPase domain-containing protein [Virgibacillus pantothenticus]MBU8646749.1 ABC-ATPase domain-containing protein [Virgibacillus pantothenticus]